MSGWNAADKWLIENTEFPASNNITGPGCLPSDVVPSGGKCFLAKINSQITKHDGSTL